MTFYRTVFIVMKYANQHEITFDSNQPYSNEELNELRFMLMKFYDCDEIHITRTDKNIAHPYIIMK